MLGRHLVLTPEKVVVERGFAPLPARIVAHLVDLLLAFAFAGATSLLAYATGPAFGDEAVVALQGLLGLTGLFAYFLLFEWLWRGQTLGKASTGLRVVMADGSPPTFAAAAYRNLLRIVDFLPIAYTLGTVVTLFNPRGQRLGDIAAGTIVVADPRVPDAFSPAPHHAGLHPLEHTLPPLSRMTVGEYVAIKRLCDRFPDLPQPTQDEGLRRIWAPFSTRHGVEPRPDVHPIYQMEAVVMKYGRMHNLL
jgi:uncharacterized RDD family membrane protein YckC